jgi:hypothetical protein
VIRTIDGSYPRIAKLLRPGWKPLTNHRWTEVRSHNELADQEASWH